MSQTPEISCPTCHKTILWSEDFHHRPFCSERCKQIDFGDWANEAHAIPGEPAMNNELGDDTQH